MIVPECAVRGTRSFIAVAVQETDIGMLDAYGQMLNSFHLIFPAVQISRLILDSEVSSSHWQFTQHHNDGFA